MPLAVLPIQENIDTALVFSRYKALCNEIQVLPFLYNIRQLKNCIKAAVDFKS